MRHLLTRSLRLVLGRPAGRNGKVGHAVGSDDSMTRTSHAGCVLPRGRPQGAVLFLLLFISTTPALGERLPLKSYTVSDGLAHNQVNKIVRDSRGFLWFCTADGLSRFDGYGFINYGTDQGLPDPNVLDFLETREGSFWVAIRAGLVGCDPKGKQRSTLTYSNVTSGSDATAARRHHSDPIS